VTFSVASSGIDMKTSDKSFTDNLTGSSHRREIRCRLAIVAFGMAFSAIELISVS
jgi:hypothetical protein